MDSKVFNKTDFEADGFSVIEGVLSSLEVDNLLIALERVSDADAVRKRGGIFAVRNLLDAVPEIHELANAPAVCALVESALGTQFLPVRGILFDKIPDANWKVPWHQDLTIAVQEKIEIEGLAHGHEKPMSCMFSRQPRS